ncbi:hypothetical protein ABMA28_002206, partial [Loxostege sticticalis]
KVELTSEVKDTCRITPKKDGGMLQFTNDRFRMLNHGVELQANTSKSRSSDRVDEV